MTLIRYIRTRLVSESFGSATKGIYATKDKIGCPTIFWRKGFFKEAKMIAITNCCPGDVFFAILKASKKQFCDFFLISLTVVCFSRVSTEGSVIWIAILLYFLWKKMTEYIYFSTIRIVYLSKRTFLSSEYEQSPYSLLSEVPIWHDPVSQVTFFCLCSRPQRFAWRVTPNSRKTSKKRDPIHVFEYQDFTSGNVSERISFICLWVLLSLKKHFNCL